MILFKLFPFDIRLLYLKTMNTKKLQTIFRVLLFSILILINFILYGFSAAGSHEGRFYTLSDASKNLVRNLDDRIT